MIQGKSIPVDEEYKEENDEKEKYKQLEFEFDEDLVSPI